MRTDENDTHHIAVINGSPFSACGTNELEVLENQAATLASMNDSELGEAARNAKIYSNKSCERFGHKCGCKPALFF